MTTCFSEPQLHSNRQLSNCFFRCFFVPLYRDLNQQLFFLQIEAFLWNFTLEFQSKIQYQPKALNWSKLGDLCLKKKKQQSKFRTFQKFLDQKQSQSFTTMSCYSSICQYSVVRIPIENCYFLRNFMFFN